jgi:hypothetical protein
MSYESVRFDQSDHRLRSGGIPVLQLPHPRPNHGDHSAQPVVVILRPKDACEPSRTQAGLSKLAGRCGAAH